jgi:hypothetical protein
MTRDELKAKFVRRLAEYLGGTNQAHMSILLEMGHREAKTWAQLRNLTPLHGYPTVEEAEKELTEWLFPNGLKTSSS